MLKREEFYSINKKTLDKYFEGQNGTSTLYVYPALNAIVTKNPSKAVKAYLKNEYAVQGNPLKKMAVQTYLKLCLATKGIMAEKKSAVKAECANDILIYPCNKKYRIFHFDENAVDVIIKDGFDDSDLVHEKEFRTKENLPAFVPSVLSVSEYGYRETIINGMPLARLNDNFEKYKNDAYALLTEFGKPYEKTIPAEQYVNQLTQDIRGRAGTKVKNKEKLFKATEKLSELVKTGTEIPIVFSHGDLQAGNIWIENNTQKIYIIDWESWGERSVWYDKAVLWGNLRPGGLTAYLPSEQNVAEKAVVLLEDLVFQLNELNSLPQDFGEQNFETYVNNLAQWNLLTGKE